MYPQMPAIGGLMAGSGIDKVEARVQRLQSMIAAVEGKKGQAATEPGQKASFGDALKKAAGAKAPTLPKGMAARAKALRPLVEKYSQQYGVEQKLVEAVIRQESGFNPQAVSSAGARGLMQLMPATAKSLGVKDSLDPAQNIEGGVKYLKGLLDRFHGNVPLALAAYNAGPGAVKRYNGVPPYKETQHYVKNVLAMYLRKNNA